MNTGQNTPTAMNRNQPFRPGHTGGLLILLTALILLPALPARASDSYLGAGTLMMLSSETPPQPGPISGPNRPCPGSTAIYTISSVPLAKDYIWDPPNGVTVLSDDNTVLEVSIGTGFVGGNLSVIAVGNDNTLSPARLLYLYKPTLDAVIETNSYISNNTIISGETYYEIANDRQLRVDVSTNMNAGSWHTTDNVSWITSPTTYYSSSHSDIVIPFTSYTGSSDRTGKLMFGCSSTLDEIYIVQKPIYANLTPQSGSTSSGSGTSSNPYILHRGGTFSLEVKTNSSWTVTYPGWLPLSGSASGSSGTVIRSFTYTASPVNLSPPRTGQITFTVNSQVFTIYVAQSENVFQPTGDGTIILNKSTGSGGEEYLTVPGSAGSFTVNMDLVNVSGTIAYNDSWISGNTTFNDSESPKTINFTANPRGDQMRTGSFVLSSSGLSKTFYVLQKEAPTTLSVSAPDNYIGTQTVGNTTEYIYTKQGGEFHTTVTTNNSWSLIACPPWVTPSPTGGTTGGSVTIDYGPFVHKDMDRAGTLTFKAGDEYKSLYIIQEHYAASCGIDPSSYIRTNTISVGYEVTATEYVLPKESGLP